MDSIKSYTARKPSCELTMYLNDRVPIGFAAAAAGEVLGEAGYALYTYGCVSGAELGGNPSKVRRFRSGQLWQEGHSYTRLPDVQVVRLIEYAEGRLKSILPREYLDFVTSARNSLSAKLEAGVSFDSIA